MSSGQRWLGPVPAVREERHYGDRVVRCFHPRPGGIDQMLAAAVARWPDRQAVADERRRLTYAALDAEVEAVAAGLQQRGIKAGDRVAILLENGAEFLVALYAAQRIGAVAVPINVREQGPEIAHILDHCGAAAIVHEAALAERLPPGRALRVALGGQTADSYEALARCAASCRRAPGSEEDVALILYTSGTTGRPKGAMLTQLGLAIAAMNYVALAGLVEGDRAGVPVPMSHVTGITAGLLPVLLVGGAVVSFRQFKASDFIARAAAEAMSFTVMVPAMYALCLLQPEFETFDLSAWRVGGYGGAPMAAATIEALGARLPHLALINCYGATETMGPQVMGPPADALRKRDCVGVPIPTAEVKIVEGEIWMRGGSVCPGYWNDPEATAREFCEGFWKSGDLGQIDAEGFVKVLDRKKDMLNRGGYKIYSAEVEQVLMAVPGVVEAAIVGKPCPVLGERVHAFVTLASPGPTEAELRAHCAAHLADYKVPESFTIGQGPLPRNANGKVMKLSLRQALLGPS